MKMMRKILLPLMIFCLVCCGKNAGPEGGGSEPEIALDKPTGLAQIDQTENSVKVSWNAVVNALEYQYCLTEEVEGLEPRVLAMGTTAGTYKTLGGLDPEYEQKGIAYYVSVAAVNGRSSSGYCDPIKVTPGQVPPPPPPPGPDATTVGAEDMAENNDYIHAFDDAE